MRYVADDGTVFVCLIEFDRHENGVRDVYTFEDCRCLTCRGLQIDIRELLDGDVTADDIGQTCDWCHEPATHITRHERESSGLLVAYWCDRHFDERQRRSDSC